MVDSYGSMVPHGGGAFYGKDCSKVSDRFGAYMARYIAKNMVAAGLASKCQVSIAYAIGVAQPVMVRSIVWHRKSVWMIVWKWRSHWCLD